MNLLLHQHVRLSYLSGPLFPRNAFESFLSARNRLYQRPCTYSRSHHTPWGGLLGCWKWPIKAKRDYSFSPVISRARVTGNKKQYCEAFGPCFHPLSSASSTPWEPAGYHYTMGGSSQKTPLIGVFLRLPLTAFGLVPLHSELYSLCKSHISGPVSVFQNCCKSNWNT